MAAIIPDDWDGETFRCHRVFWPDSEQYSALLLGQLTEPDRVEFWDSSFGDVGEAQGAIVNAALLTIDEIAKECCEGCEMPIPFFRARMTEDQSINADTWTKVLFNLLENNFNSPEYSTTNSHHAPVEVDNQGLWQYQAMMAFVGVPAIYVAIAVNDTGIKYNYLPSGIQEISGAIPITNNSTHISIYVLSPGVSATLSSQAEYAWFEGFRVGPLV